MFEIVVPKVEVLEQPESETENHGTIQLEPLEPGFGTTLGNALRRVLLSSLPGAAVNSLRIDGVHHEFAAIPGVKEDVTELVLNIKQLRLRYDGDEPKSIQLEVKGVGRVTAADLQAPPEIEIINPELYLMSVDLPDGGVTLELTVQKGKGYAPADHHEGLPIGVIPIDAIFTPIRKVNFSVEETRIGVTTKERLILDVWTDGTIKPAEAVAESANILLRQFNILSGLIAKPELPGDKQATTTAAIPPRLYDVPIEDLDLSVRAYNCLKRAGLLKVGQVLEMTEDDLLSVRNFGRKSLDELRERLAARGYLENSRLAPTPDEAEEDEEEAAVADEDLVDDDEAEEEEDEEEEELVLPDKGEDEEEEIPTYTFTPDAEEAEESGEPGGPPKEPAYEGDWDPNRNWDEDEDEQGFRKKASRRRRAR